MLQPCKYLTGILTDKTLTFVKLNYWFSISDHNAGHINLYFLTRCVHIKQLFAKF
jgi:hypothetical protein